MAIDQFKQFVQLESLAGLLLFAAGLTALALSNSPLAELYHHILSMPVSMGFGSWVLSKSLLLWINEGLMTLFFFLVGLEIKEEMIHGHLQSLKQMALPGIAAIGGIVVPALVYMFYNHQHGFLSHMGWAIPTATDIAFTLALLRLFQHKIPMAVKTLLTAIAIFDDLGAIIIIAIFYTASLQPAPLLGAGIVCVALIILNRTLAHRTWPYYLLGLILWFLVLKSGVHSTLAGVILAFAMPIDLCDERQVMDRLHPYVAYIVLPLFAFANAGLTIQSLTLSDLMHPVSIGIIIALFIGKPLGILGLTKAAIRSNIAALPTGVRLCHLNAIACLCGVGFTMSLFIGILAYEDIAPHYLTWVKVGVLTGSILSAITGCLLLRKCTGDKS